MSNRISIFAANRHKMTDIPRWEQRLESYHKALSRLAEVINESHKHTLSSIECDGLVQRFEFTHELAWKLMKAYANYQGFTDIADSRDATRKAFEMGLIQDGQAWMDMIKSRNETSHNYDGDVANGVVKNVIGRFYPLMQQFHDKMKSLSASSPTDLFAQ